jgi:hypothetical protein
MIPAGKLNRAGVNWSAVLLHQQNFLFRCHSENDGCAGGVDPVSVFPMAFFDQSQKLAGMQGGSEWIGSFAFQKIGALHGGNPARFISAMAFAHRWAGD